MNKKLIIGATAVVVVLAIIGSYYVLAQKAQKNGEQVTKTNEVAPAKYAGKKVLYVNSYHEGYAWSDSLAKGIQSTFKGTGVELKTIVMDTKRNDSAEFGKEAGLKAKAVIDEFKPDVVIISDDPAFKYLLMPYYKNAQLPFVYAAINWDASIYGTPYSNATGIIETDVTPKLLDLLKEYTKGDRVSILLGDTLSDKKNIEYYSKLFNINFTQKYLVKTFDEWKKAFLEAQTNSDILLVQNNAGITGWNNEEAKAFALENTKIVSGAVQSYMADLNLISLTKVGEEHGEWSAQTALKILDGASPSSIPEAVNAKSDLILNMNMAKKLNVVFPPALIRIAKTIIKAE